MEEGKASSYVLQNGVFEAKDNAGLGGKLYCVGHTVWFEQLVKAHRHLLHYQIQTCLGDPYSEKLYNVRVTQSAHHFALRYEFGNISVSHILCQPPGIFLCWKSWIFLAAQRVLATSTSSTQP